MSIGGDKRDKITMGIEYQKDTIFAGVDEKLLQRAKLDSYLRDVAERMNEVYGLGYWDWDDVPPRDKQKLRELGYNPYKAIAEDEAVDRAIDNELMNYK